MGKKKLFVTKIIVLFFLLQWSTNFSANAQELKARVTVLANRIGTQVDRKIFQTLEKGLNNFLNNRKWTSNVYQPQERIECSFLINIDRALSNNGFVATLTVQAARPVYNSSYLSPLVNFQDPNFAFRYVEFQPLEFNENRVQGNDPMVGNLTAVLAYYVYIILGVDHDSFALKGGDPYFQRAQNIVNNAPDSREITGWKAFDGMRNRYWLAENLLSPRYTLVHDAVYEYFRMGFDKLQENPAEGRKNVLEALRKLQQVNLEQPNSMVMQFFFQGRSDELIKLFAKAPPEEKNAARDLLMKLDITNGPSYQAQLK